MIADSLKLFETATQQVFSEIGFTHLSSEPPGSVSQPQGIVATVGLTGTLLGYISLSTTIESGQSFVQKLFENLQMDIDEQGFGQFHQEAMSELVNQITGRSTTLLEQDEINCDITPPTIVVGENLYFNLSQLTESLHRVIKGDFGSITLFVGIQKVNAKEE
ncbi:MAG: chemotaxis protein CheX [Spirochaetia bacterium]